MVRIICAVLVIAFLIGIIVENRNDIFPYNPETGKTDFDYKSLLSLVYVWLIAGGLVLFFII